MEINCIKNIVNNSLKKLILLLNETNEKYFIKISISFNNIRIQKNHMKVTALKKFNNLLQFIDSMSFKFEF